MADVNTGMSMRAVERLDNGATLERLVLGYVAEVNALTGEHMSDAAMLVTTRAVIDRWMDRSVNALVIALRDGVNSGKIYGKVNYTVIAQWLTDHEAAIEDHNYRQHLASK